MNGFYVEYYEFDSPEIIKYENINEADFEDDDMYKSFYFAKMAVVTRLRQNVKDRIEILKDAEEELNGAEKLTFDEIRTLDMEMTNE